MKQGDGRAGAIAHRLPVTPGCCKAEIMLLPRLVPPDGVAAWTPGENVFPQSPCMRFWLRCSAVTPGLPLALALFCTAVSLRHAHLFATDHICSFKYLD